MSIWDQLNSHLRNNMNNLSLIVVIGNNNEIGRDNKLLWHLPNDLKFFKETTLNKTVIMGRKTFESLPNKLPNRKHIILSNNKDYKIDDVLTLNSVEEVLDYIKNTDEECFIIGGSTIYQLFLPYSKYLYLTKVDDTKEADSYFPIIDELNYDVIHLGDNEDNGIKYKHYKYINKKHN